MIAKKVMTAVSLSSKIIPLHDTELLSLMLASVVAFDYRTVVHCWFLMHLDEARNKTNLSGGLDNTKLTPAKVLTESAEEIKLAGGA